MVDLIKERIGFRELLNRLGITVQKNGFIFSIYKTENTASTKIDFSKNVYYDFSVGKGGDVIEFYKDYIQKDYKTAINELANMCNITDYKPNYDQPKKTESKTDSDKFDIKDLSDLELTAYPDLLNRMDKDSAYKELQKMRIQSNSDVFLKFWSLCWDMEMSDKLRDYLINYRKFNKQTIYNFRLCEVTDYHRINNKMKTVFPLHRLKLSGLYNDKGNLIFAKHRLIIPYLYNDKIVYMRARYFDENGDFESKDCSKYIGLRNDSLNVNSPKRFFNGDQLKSMIKGEKLFITEGEFDCMIVEQAGKNAIGLPGVGNIPDIRRLKGLHIVICMDNDEAGEIAKNKLVELFKVNNIDFSFFNFEGKDVNDWYKRRLDERNI